MPHETDSTADCGETSQEWPFDQEMSGEDIFGVDADHGKGPEATPETTPEVTTEESWAWLLSSVAEMEAYAVGLEGCVTYLLKT